MVRQRILRKVKIGKNKEGAIEYWVDQEISLGETNDEMLIYLEWVLQIMCSTCPAEGEEKSELGRIFENKFQFSFQISWQNSAQWEKLGWEGWNERGKEKDWKADLKIAKSSQLWRCRIHLKG